MPNDPIPPFTADDITRRYDFLGPLIREAGGLARSYFRQPTRLGIETKGTQDFVTAADRAVEAFLVGRILAAFPGDGVLGEEGGRQGSESGPVWVIDPIDGTANFARGLSFWCISVALMVGGDIVFGIIHDPVGGETFAARQGAGAFCDDQPMAASTVATPDRARINLGYSFRCKPDGILQAIDRMVASQCEWNRLGSAALALAYVACGRLDGHWAPFVNVWDVAAGICLVREAGGWVSDFLADDGLHKGNPILASAPGMTAFFREKLGDLL